MEIWDAYDKDFKKILGVELVRGNSVPNNLFHLVCDIIVQHIDGEYLLIQRDPRKHHGNMWEATAGGSALKGETSLQCAYRELNEETGITANNLIEVGRDINMKNHSIYVEYLCITDCPKDSIVLQEGETCAYKWVSRDDLLNKEKDELVTLRIFQFIDELRGY